MTLRRSPHRGARHGFTLTELLVVLVLLSAVLATLMGVIVRQQRFYRGATEIMSTRGHLRQATNLLPVELRGLSSVGGDIFEMADTAVEFAATVGSSILCQGAAGSAIVVLPPTRLASGTRLTGWVAQPSPDTDVALVYDEGASASRTNDDAWRTFQIAALEESASASDCPASTGFTSAADDAEPRWTLTLAAPLESTNLIGSPIRFLRRVRYSLYLSPTDDKWYLGYRRCSWGGACDAIEPVSGPYRPPNLGDRASSGLVFRFLDQDGAETADPARVARIELTVRGETESVISIPGLRREPYRDELAVTVAVRNRL